MCLLNLSLGFYIQEVHHRVLNNLSLLVLVPYLHCIVPYNHSTTLNPFGQIQGSLEIYKARGGSKGSIKAEAPTMAFAFASVVTIGEIKEGEKFSEENIWVKRPGIGDFLAKDYKKLLGKKVNKKILSGKFIKKKYLKKL